jgi:hypothetical protein
MNSPLNDRCHFAVTVAIRSNCYNFYHGQSRGNLFASLPNGNGKGKGYLGYLTRQRHEMSFLWICE